LLSLVTATSSVVEMELHPVFVKLSYCYF